MLRHGGRVSVAVARRHRRRRAGLRGRRHPCGGRADGGRPHLLRSDAGAAGRDPTGAPCERGRATARRPRSARSLPCARRSARGSRRATACARDRADDSAPLQRRVHGRVPRSRPEFDVGLHMHLAESRVQAQVGRARYGRSLTAHLGTSACSARGSPPRIRSGSTTTTSSGSPTRVRRSPTTPAAISGSARASRACGPCASVA